MIITHFVIVDKTNDVFTFVSAIRNICVIILNNIVFRFGRLYVSNDDLLFVYVEVNGVICN